MKNILAFGGIAVAGLLVPIFALAAPKGPECVSFEASHTRVEKGDRVDLSWETTNGTSLRIEPDLYKTGLASAVKQGEVTVFPKKTTEYTLMVSRGSQSDTCTVTVVVADTVATHSTRTHSVTHGNTLAPVSAYVTRDQQPLAAVAISAIPYTGVDVTPFLTSLFFVLLSLWIACVAYMVTRRTHASPAGAEMPTAFGSIIPHSEYRRMSEHSAL